MRVFEDDLLTERIIGCAIEVHKALGPGLVESTYEEALCLEMQYQKLEFSRQLRCPVLYRDEQVGEYRPDVVVEQRVVVEIKSVDRLIGLHRAQVLGYMRILKIPVGLILNFNGEVLRTGIMRLVL